MIEYTTTLTALYGCPDHGLPLKGFPDGLPRVHLDQDSFMIVEIDGPEGNRHFMVAEQNGCWVPFIEVTPTDPKNNP